MDQSIESVIRETLSASNCGRIHFGQVVGNLIGAGVESYNVDYRACRATYYMPCGETLTLELDAPEVGIAMGFSATAIKRKRASAPHRQVVLRMI